VNTFWAGLSGKCIGEFIPAVPNEPAPIENSQHTHPRNSSLNRIVSSQNSPFLHAQHSSGSVYDTLYLIAVEPDATTGARKLYPSCVRAENSIVPI